MPNGTYTYPTDGAYAMNAADLVEFRVKPLADSTAFRITLNTIKDARLYGMTIAIGGTPGVELPMPDGANTTAPADMFLTVHGTSAKLVHAVSGADLGTVAVKVDGDRRRSEVRVPHAACDRPQTFACAACLWTRERPLPDPQRTPRDPLPWRRQLAAPTPSSRRVPPDEPTPAPTTPRNGPRGVVARPAPRARSLAGTRSAIHVDVDFAEPRAAHRRHEGRDGPDGPQPRDPLRDRAGPHTEAVS